MVRVAQFDMVPSECNRHKSLTPISVGVLNQSGVPEGEAGGVWGRGVDGPREGVKGDVGEG